MVQTIQENVAQPGIPTVPGDTIVLTPTDLQTFRDGTDSYNGPIPESLGVGWTLNGADLGVHTTLRLVAGNPGIALTGSRYLVDPQDSAFMNQTAADTAGGFFFPVFAVPAPTGLAVSGVDSTSATLSWTNGISRSGMLTEVEYTDGVHASYDTVAGGITSDTITGLTPSTSYTAYVRHIVHGLPGTQAGLGFATRGGALHIIDFVSRHCTLDTHGSDLDFDMVTSGASGNLGWVIAETSTATQDPGTGTVIATGNAHGFAWSLDTTAFVATPPSSGYFWFRFPNATTDAANWFGLDNNPIDVARCQV